MTGRGGASPHEAPAADVLVVGSGASAANAAWPLVEAGWRVTMLDVGDEDSRLAPRIPDAPFAEIRRRDAGQHVWMLGDRAEGVPLDPLGPGPQVTPPRAHVLRGVPGLAPSDPQGFAPLESLARGGLAGAWGAVSFPFLEGELARCGIAPREMRRHYEVVARRIGVSGEPGDLAAVSGTIEALQPSLRLDTLAEEVLLRYTRRREAFHREGIRIGRPFLAALSRPLGERRAHRGHDMDFWSNAGGSVYRPDLAIRELGRRPGFTYRRGWFVERFTEADRGGVAVVARRVRLGKEAGEAPEVTEHRETFRARRVVLAAGTLGTARIVLRSLDGYDTRVPLVCNPHTYMPCLVPSRLGRPARDDRHSLAQLTLILDPAGDLEHLVQAQLYSYRSLLLFRLLQDLRLPQGPALRLLRVLGPALALWVVQHEDRPATGKFLALRRDPAGGSDRLEIHYEEREEDALARARAEGRIRRALRRLGCLPLEAHHEPHGASVHYAGPFPFAAEDRPLTTEPSGRLRGTRGVYVADGAAFPCLPAKGVTLTLMANADRVARCVGESLEEER